MGKSDELIKDRVFQLNQYPPGEISERYDEDIREGIEYALERGINEFEIKADASLLYAGCITRVVIRDVFRERAAKLMEIEAPKAGLTYNPSMFYASPDGYMKERSFRGEDGKWHVIVQIRPEGLMEAVQKRMREARRQR